MTFNRSDYDFSEVLISVREPFNKNTIWIQPYKGNLYVKLFDKGWQVMYSTEDKGLSTRASEQVNKLVESLQSNIIDKLKKQFGKQNQSSISLMQRQSELEKKVNDLESKLERLTNRYSKLSTKLNSNGQ